MATRPRSRVKPLTVREVQTATAGEHADGGGMLLRVSMNSAQWVLRYTSPSGKRREMGLGACFRTSAAVAGRSLTGAREQAHSARSQLSTGIDPIDHRAALRLAAKAEAKATAQADQRVRFTLARAARGYHERVIEGQRTTKHAVNWIASLEKNVAAAIWNKPIDAITAPELLDAMTELRARIPETASRVRQRLDVVFDDAEFRGHCTGNPARAIRKKLAESRSGRDRGQFAALPVNLPSLRLTAIGQKPSSGDSRRIASKQTSSSAMEDVFTLDFA